MWGFCVYGPSIYRQTMIEETMLMLITCQCPLCIASHAYLTSKMADVFHVLFGHLCVSLFQKPQGDFRKSLNYIWNFCIRSIFFQANFPQPLIVSHLLTQQNRGKQIDIATFGSHFLRSRREGPTLPFSLESYCSLATRAGWGNCCWELGIEAKWNEILWRVSQTHPMLHSYIMCLMFKSRSKICAGWKKMYWWTAPRFSFSRHPGRRQQR